MIWKFVIFVTLENLANIVRKEVLERSYCHNSVKFFPPCEVLVEGIVNVSKIYSFVGL